MDYPYIFLEFRDSTVPLVKFYKQLKRCIMKTLNQNELEMLYGGRDKGGEFREGFCYGMAVGFAVVGLAPLGAFLFAFSVASVVASTACVS